MDDEARKQAEDAAKVAARITAHREEVKQRRAERDGKLPGTARGRDENAVLDGEIIPPEKLEPPAYQRGLNRNGKPLKFTKQQIADALHRSRGNKTSAAAKLGCDRETVQRYTKRFPELNEIRNEAIEMVLDVCDANIENDIIQNKNVNTSFRYAAYFGRGRGYTDRMELTGVDGGAIQTETGIKIKIRWLDDD